MLTLQMEYDGFSILTEESVHNLIGAFSRKMVYMNIGFYISGYSHRLMKYLERTSKEERDSIKIVFSDSTLILGTRLESWINRHNIDLTVFKSPEVEESNQRNILLSNALLNGLLLHDVDYCFSFGKHILQGGILKIYHNKIINFHPSILPMYPGLHSLDRAESENRTLLVGNTAHFVDDGVDTGAIIMQSVIPLQAFIESNRNYDVVLDLQIDMLHKLMILLKDKRIEINDNGRVIIKGANYKNSQIFPFIN